MDSGRFSDVLCCVRTTAGASPGRLATSHPGPPRRRQQSRFELLSLFHAVFVCVVFKDVIYKYLTNNGVMSSALGNLLWIPSLKVSLLIWELSFDSAATSSHIVHSLGVPAAVRVAAAHAPNFCFEFQKHPPRIQSQQQSTTAAVHQQKRTLCRPICTGGTPLFCVPPFQLATPPENSS